VVPIRIEEAIPSCQPGLVIIKTFLLLISGAIDDALAPNTVITGCRWASSIASIAPLIKLLPLYCKSCFGLPSRVDAPAARRIAAQWFIMN